MRTLKYLTWLLMGIGVVFLWLSLRSTTDNLEYTIYALVSIMLAWITNYFLRKDEKEKKEQ